MTGLGKWLVVLHCGMSLMAATMGIVLFATEPDYAGRLKDKADQVATQRKSLDLNGAAKREFDGRTRIAQLENYWFTTEPYFEQLLKHTVDAPQANTIQGIVRNPMTGLPVPDQRPVVSPPWCRCCRRRRNWLGRRRSPSCWPRSARGLPRRRCSTRG